MARHGTSSRTPRVQKIIKAQRVKAAKQGRKR